MNLFNKEWYLVPGLRLGSASALQCPLLPPWLRPARPRAASPAGQRSAGSAAQLITSPTHLPALPFVASSHHKQIYFYTPALFGFVFFLDDTHISLATSSFTQVSSIRDCIMCLYVTHEDWENNVTQSIIHCAWSSLKALGMPRFL